MADKLAILLR